MAKCDSDVREIVYAVKQIQLGIPVRQIARKYGVSPSELKRQKELQRENGQLKKLVAELSLDKEILQDVLRKKL